ncbi:hypothetical protein VP01_1549g2 [Puccinia sorghi]|uniref:Uncharacterized protein n=1 Tax=Puccinia sorghi TaxID=27349 RepID=A0A0L6VI65_9BASI|nr:hypothetical protein VP01_1549g2 [Puccinia sorghi]
MFRASITFHEELKNLPTATKAIFHRPNIEIEKGVYSSVTVEGSAYLTGIGSDPNLLQLGRPIRMQSRFGVPRMIWQTSRPAYPSPHRWLFVIGVILLLNAEDDIAPQAERIKRQRLQKQADACSQDRDGNSIAPAASDSVPTIPYPDNGLDLRLAKKAPQLFLRLALTICFCPGMQFLVNQGSPSIRQFFAHSPTTSWKQRVSSEWC